MTEYTLHGASSEMRDISGFRHVLRLPSLQPLVFPGITYEGVEDDTPKPENIVPIPTPDAFDPFLKRRLDENDEEGYQLICTAIVGNSGIWLASTILFQESSIPSTLNLHFSSESIQQDIMNYDVLKQLIYDIAPVFRADQLCVEDLAYINSIGPMGGMVLPRFLDFGNCGMRQFGIHWMSYFNSDLVEYLGRDRFSRLHTFEEKIDVNGGVFVSLQREPFEIENPAHYARFWQAIEELGFKDFAIW
jgi:hypothetical protein